MLYAIVFLVFFCILYFFAYFFIKKWNSNLNIGDTINLGLLLIAISAVLISIFSFNGWKSQYYLNNKEKLLNQISEQLEKTDNQIQSYQRLIENFSQNPQINSREAIFDAYYSTEFHLNKLNYLLEKSSKEIESQCTNLQTSALKNINNLVVNQITSYSKIETTLFDTVSNPYNRLSSKELKIEQIKFSQTNSELDFSWRGVSNAILISTIKLSGDKKLEDPIKFNESCQLNNLIK